MHNHHSACEWTEESGFVQMAKSKDEGTCAAVYADNISASCYRVDYSLADAYDECVDGAEP